ncbi:cystatin family protein [Limnohabitans sp.]|uniref:cystatin family protein n=1 Tax=Limnohabitans sp. TaxID=1907725 RepID=UPI002AFEBA96|nr:cystatin domain-containing protein [Limnohabitans sp.]
MLNLSRLFTVLAFGLIAACSPEKPAAVSAPHSEAAPVAGAWAPADAFSPEAQEAARFAVQTFAVQNKARVLYKNVVKARQQVVAGLNFELQLQVTLDGASRSVSATVWRHPDGTYRLQAWDWLD